jgi:hypothetical protein
VHTHEGLKSLFGLRFVKTGRLKTRSGAQGCRRSPRRCG